MGPVSHPGASVSPAPALFRGHTQVKTLLSAFWDFCPAGRKGHGSGLTAQGCTVQLWARITLTLDPGRQEHESHVCGGVNAPCQVPSARGRNGDPKASHPSTFTNTGCLGAEWRYLGGRQIRGGGIFAPARLWENPISSWPPPVFMSNKEQLTVTEPVPWA